MNLRTLDLNLLRVFDAVYGAGSVSAAARLLGMSQPTVSAALARLREATDDPLFVRAREGVAPTPRAEEIAGPIRDGLARIDQAVVFETSFDPASITRTATLGVVESAEPLLLSSLLPVIRDDAPELSLLLRDLSDQDVSTGLYDGSIDMAVHDTPVEARHIHCEIMFQTELVCVAQRGWQQRNAPVTPENFASLPFIALKTKERAHMMLDRVLASQGCVRRIVYQTSGYWSMSGLVAGTETVAVLPRIFFNEVHANFDLEEIPIPYDVPKDVGYLIWHARNDDDQALTWIRNSCAQVFRDHERAMATGPEAEHG